MKKSALILLCLLSSAFLLTGCGKTGEAEPEENDWTDGLTKAQKIEVSLTNEKKPIKVIDEQAGVDEFVSKLNLDSWKLADVPDGGVPERDFTMYQEATTKLGASNDQSKTMKEVAEITTYKNIPYIDFTVSNNTFSFEVPKQVMKALNQQGAK